MLEVFRTQVRGSAPRASARRHWARGQVWVLMLLSAIGVMGAAALWIEAGLAYAALTYALTIALLYGLVVRLVGRGVVENGGGSPNLVSPPAAPLRPTSEPPPLQR